MNRFGLVIVCVALANCTAKASDLEDATTMFKTGKYDEAESLAAAQVEKGIWNERWPRLLIEIQMTRGKYAEAKKVYEDAILRYPTSLTLRMQGMQVLRYSGLREEATESQFQILQLLQASPTRYTSRDNLIAAGRFFQMRGEDGRQILEMFYDRVLDVDPRQIEAYLATAELALAKGDFKVAADTLQNALRFDETDPRIHYMLARAWEPSDSEKATAAIDKAISINPNHAPSLIFQADAAIDREQYSAAELLIRKVLQVNPRHQEAFALMAVLAHIRGKYDIESKMRDTALSSWGDNPRVDHLIGLKLSQKYRFDEGRKYQQRALEMDPNYAPASFQLAQDLLRLGNDEVGWKLAKDVADEDPYNVVAHNLMTLYDRMKDFSILEAEGIQVKMESKEAQIYGQQVIDLLREAKDVLCEKYQIEPRAPIVVEIFPQQKDFAIRTFGLPGGDGYLGVCFGRVITANSPASQGENPSNWKSVLWHEFCHVVTLEKTRNRMPRWLSEGISVYEERQRDASWGEAMTPLYREMMLGDSLTPVSQLSAAFLTPPTPIHLQFAYYESSLVIEFLVERFGIESLVTLLEDLGNGLPVDDALVRNFGPLERLDSEFAEYARSIAESFGADANWARDLERGPATLEQLDADLTEDPNQYWVLRELASKRFEQEDFEGALELLKRLDDLGTFTGESGDPLRMLARCYSELGQIDEERKTLQRIIEMSSDALPALRRLIEMAKTDSQWDRINEYANKITAINPLIPDGHLALADAAEQLGKPGLAADALRTVGLMDPLDPAELDFRLATNLAKDGDRDTAKHHVLRALEQAPRYRAAHRLLLSLVEEPANEAAEPTSEDASDAPAEPTQSTDETQSAEVTPPTPTPPTPTSPDTDPPDSTSTESADGSGAEAEPSSSGEDQAVDSEAAKDPGSAGTDESVSDRANESINAVKEPAQ